MRHKVQTYWYAGALLALLACLFILTHRASAANLTGRSVLIQTAIVNATTSHQARFNYISSSNVGSVVFEYCDNSPLFEDPCQAPPGLDVSQVSLTAQSGETGFSIASRSSNEVVISRPQAAVTPGPANYTFSNAINASTPNQTIFLRISTHASNDGSGINIDQGTVAFSLSAGLSVNAFVPPFLALCAGVTVSVDCSSSSGVGVDLGTLRATQTSAGTTQLAAATNDANGYNLFMEGTTLTSGNNTITALSRPTISSPATSQFGVNLRANTSPAVGRDREGNGSATAAVNYDQANLFTFNDGDTIITANSSTAYNRFTVSYIANIPFGQAPGVYSTTLTYVATASF